MAVGATPNGLPILWVVDVLLCFLEIADLFGLVLLEAVPLYLRMHSPTLPVTGQVDKRVLNCEYGLWQWFLRESEWPMRHFNRSRW